MKRQGFIYLILSLGAAAMFAYVGSTCWVVWNQFGPSLTFAMVMIAAGVFSVLVASYATLAFVFLTRAVAQLSVAPGGVVLEPDLHAGFNNTFASTPRLIRVVGAQFSSDEAEPKFAVFQAGNKLWVTPASQWRIAWT